VTVYNEAAEILVAREKRLSDLKQVVRVLLLERSSRMYAGMDKKAFAVVVKEGQRAKPLDVSWREIE
jgi:hypothetical protein